MTPSPFSRLATATVTGLVSIAAQSWAGIKTFTSAIIASAGIQTASAFNTNGTGASDVGVKVGVSTLAASVNGSAKLLSVRSGIGGTEVEHYYFTKTLLFLGGLGQWWLETSGNDLYVSTGGAYVSRYISATGFVHHGFGLSVGPGVGGAASFSVPTNGRIDQSGTDSTGTPGAATINKPSGKSAIAAGQSSVVITNSLVTAASRPMITPYTRDATCKELIVVAGAGFFTVSGTANATAALSFGWQTSDIL